MIRYINLYVNLLEDWSTLAFSAIYTGRFVILHRQCRAIALSQQVQTLDSNLTPDTAKSEPWDLQQNIRNATTL